MTTALVEFPENDQVLASLFLDTVVLGHGRAPEMGTVALHGTTAVRSAPPLHGDVLAKRRPGSLIARWVPDPRSESGLICIWVAQTGTEAAVSLDA